MEKKPISKIAVRQRQEILANRNVLLFKGVKPHEMHKILDLTRGLRTFFMLNTTEHDVSTAH